MVEEYSQEALDEWEALSSKEKEKRLERARAMAREDVAQETREYEEKLELARAMARADVAREEREHQRRLELARATAGERTSTKRVKKPIPRSSDLGIKRAAKKAFTTTRNGFQAQRKQPTIGDLLRSRGARVPGQLTGTLGELVRKFRRR